ncbi:hypothetical protein GGX14DRAFT_570691 [Mycena pura]|uniref:Alkyl hydroperoxide reductase subunit C/ Thiol specific antioxidant domain-containing protein n=1 Tax=Mycena pura TaxID=153505 RepID=A0AAD6V8C5_9AGAR|nr:hypothetical protein GGX14DRAFT_570691 [Mycena pura]
MHHSQTAGLIFTIYMLVPVLAKERDFAPVGPRAAPDVRRLPRDKVLTGAWRLWLNAVLLRACSCVPHIHGHAPGRKSSHSDALPVLKEINTVVLGISTDSHGLALQLVADRSMQIARAYSVLLKDAGIVLRGLFIIDPAGALRTSFAIVMHCREGLWGHDALHFGPDLILGQAVARERYISPFPSAYCLSTDPEHLACLGQQFAYHEVSFLMHLMQTFFRGPCTRTRLTPPPYCDGLPEEWGRKWNAEKHLNARFKGGRPPRAFASDVETWSWRGVLPKTPKTPKTNLLFY